MIEKQFKDVIYKKLEWLSREELIDRFVSVEFARFLSYYKNAPDLNIDENARDEREDKRGKRRDRDGNFSRFFINIGSKKKLSPTKLMGLINDTTKKRDIQIGKIDIMDSFSFFEVDTSFEQEILAAFTDYKYKGMNVTVELSKEKKSGGGDRGGNRGGSNKRNYSKRKPDRRKGRR